MRDKIICWLKLFLLIWPPTMGYAFVFLLVWASLGLPLEYWAILLGFAFASLAECLFLKWVGRWGDDAE